MDTAAIDIQAGGSQQMFIDQITGHLCLINPLINQGKALLDLK
jgi:hypothetical protein